MSLMLANLLSANPETRVGAEHELRALQASQPEALCRALWTESRSTTQSAIHDLVLVLLRQTVRLNWGAAEEQKLGIGLLLFENIVSESGQQPAHIDSKCIEAFVALPPPLLAQFTPNVIKLVESMTRPWEPILHLMDGFAEYVDPDPFFEPFSAKLAMWLQANERSKGIFKATVSLLAATRGKARTHATGATLAAHLVEMACHTVLGGAPARLESKEEEEEEEEKEAILETCVTLADHCAWALELRLRETSEALLRVCESTSMPSSCRSLAMTVFAYGVAARKASSICKEPEFCARVLRCVLDMQMQDDDDEDDENEADEGEEIDVGDLLGASAVGMRGAALECVASLAMGSARVVAHSSTFWGITLQLCRPLLAMTGEPHGGRGQAVALSTLGTVAPMLDVTKVLTTGVLGELVRGCMQLSCASSSSTMIISNRIRLLACAVVYELLASDCTGATVRRMHHGDIIPGLAQGLADHKAPSRLVSVWLATLAKFYDEEEGEGREEEDAAAEEEEGFKAMPSEWVLPYMEGLAPLLVRRLELGSSVPGLLMDALSALARHAKHAFAPYYTGLVPGLKQVLAMSPPVAGATRRSAMLLVASCAEAAGKEVFAHDAQEIVGWFVNRQQHTTGGPNGDGGKDPTEELEGLFVFCERVSAVLGAEFAGFVPAVLPLVMQALQADLEVCVHAKEAEDGGFDEHSGRATVCVPIRGVQGPVEISANIYAFQLRLRALKLVEALAHAGCLVLDVPHQEVMGPILQAVTPTILDPQATVGLNSQACDTACELFLLVCKRFSPQHASSSPSPQPIFVLLVTQFLTGLSDASSSERRGIYAQALERVTRICFITKQGCAPAQLLPHVFAVMVEALGGSVQRRLAGPESTAQGLDTEALEDLREECEEAEVELSTALVDAMGFLLKTDPPGVYPIFSTVVLRGLAPCLGVDFEDGCLHHHALCCYVDAVEFAGPLGGHDPALVEGVGTALVAAVARLDSALLRQVGAYGVGVLASKTTWQGCQAAATAVLAALARPEDDNDVRDNLVGALARLYVAKGVPEWQLAWVSHLPLQDDHTEAVWVHDLALQLTAEGRLVDPERQEARVLKLCAHLLAQKDKEEVWAGEMAMAPGGWVAQVAHGLGGKWGMPRLEQELRSWGDEAQGGPPMRGRQALWDLARV